MGYVSQKQLDELEQKLTSKLTMLQAEIKSCKQEVSNLRRENQELKDENSSLKKEIDSNKDAINQAEVKADGLENRQRRNNLIFHGIEGDGLRESWEDVEQKVAQFIEHDLKMGQAVKVERAHRSGIIKGGKARPIVALFSSWKDKEVVKKKARELKSATKYVTDDFSFRVRQLRRKLMDYAEKNKEENSKYHLRYDKLILYSKAYRFDELEDKVIPCTSRTRQDQEEEERESEWEQVRHQRARGGRRK